MLRQTESLSVSCSLTSPHLKIISDTKRWIEKLRTLVRDRIHCVQIPVLPLPSWKILWKSCLFYTFLRMGCSGPELANLYKALKSGYLIKIGWIKIILRPPLCRVILILKIKKYMLVLRALQTECLVETCCSQGAQQIHPNFLRGVSDNLTVEAKSKMNLSKQKA